MGGELESKEVLWTKVMKISLNPFSKDCFVTLPSWSPYLVISGLFVGEVHDRMSTTGAAPFHVKKLYLEAGRDVLLEGVLLHS